MFKLLLVSVILSQVSSLPCGSESNATDINIKTQLPENYQFYAQQQTFYVNAPNGWKGPAGLNSDTVGQSIRSDYTISKGIGAHKVHCRKLSWNNARKACVAEGGHLAIIRSDAEEKIVRAMLADPSSAAAWVGLHDQFGEGDWVTILDEPMATISGPQWTPTNPDNYKGNENCATFGAGGLNDDTCSKQFPFVCKISIS